MKRHSESGGATPLMQPAPVPAADPLADAARTVAPAVVRSGITNGERVQLVLAGGLWLAAAIVLSVRGVGWLLPVAWAPLLLVAGVALGLAKARFLLDRVAGGVARRIHDRGPQAPVVGFLSVRSWVTVVVMMAGGHALRLTEVPRPVLGVLYVGIATALAVASRAYWRVLYRGWGSLG